MAAKGRYWVALWLLFLVAFAILAVITLVVVRIERHVLTTGDSNA